MSALPPPRERYDTLPDEWPKLSIGWHVAAWMMDNLVQPNGKSAGQPFTPTPRQLQFLVNYYAINEDGEFTFRRGVRRLAKGSGKAERLDAPLPTPDGWTTVGAVRAGDYVIGGDGRPVRVVKAHDVHAYDAYRVRFSDGSESVYSSGHLFTVDVFTGGAERTRQTLSVQDMYEAGLTYARPLTAGHTKCATPGVAKYALPDTPPMHLPARHLPIDPYVLGYWLGDGDSDCGRITVGREDLDAALNLLGGRNELGVPKVTGTAFRIRVKGLTRRLREAHLLRDKHIPADYLRASLEQRVDLLRGLMDSDGTVARSGQAEYCTTSQRLALDVAELIRTCGYKVNVRESDARLRGRKVGSRYRLTFKPYAHRNVFALPRKASRVREQLRKPLPRTIKAIEPCGKVPMRCITVANEDGLYLTGDTMIVTHNSPFAAAFALAELCGPVRFGGWDESELAGIRAIPASMPLVQIVATSERQTQNTIRMVRAFAAKGTKVQRTYELDSNKTFIETPFGGKLEQVTSSAHTLEGGEVSAAVCDEVEHWLPAQGGPEVMRTVLQNAAKVDGARVLETCNAWIPGEKSTAEDTWEAWLKQEDGETVGDTRILYDAVIARPNATLTDSPQEGQIGVTEELERLYADCPWVNLKQIKEQIWSPDYPESRSLRFFFNRPTASENAWVTLEEWNLCSKTDREVKDGEPIVMFFDGSKSDDHTALVGCCMEDGHIFKIGHWRPGSSKVIDTHAVNAGVESAFHKWDVVAFWADVREWESFTKVTWPEKYGDRLILPAEEKSPIAWDMRTHARQFAEAAEAAFTEITQQEFTHSGDSALAEHVTNARVFEQRGRWSIRKESPKSSHKIDLAVCMVGARMLYRNVLTSKVWQRRTSGNQWKVFK